MSNQTQDDDIGPLHAPDEAAMRASFEAAGGDAPYLGDFAYVEGVVREFIAEVAAAIGAAMPTASSRPRTIGRRALPLHRAGRSGSPTGTTPGSWAPISCGTGPSRTGCPSRTRCGPCS